MCNPFSPLHPTPHSCCSSDTRPRHPPPTCIQATSPLPPPTHTFAPLTITRSHPFAYTPQLLQQRLASQAQEQALRDQRNRVRLTGDRNAQRQARLQALQRTAVECQAALLARSGELRKSHSVLPVGCVCWP